MFQFGLTQNIASLTAHEAPQHGFVFDSQLSCILDYPVIYEFLDFSGSQERRRAFFFIVATISATGLSRVLGVHFRLLGIVTTVVLRLVIVKELARGLLRVPHSLRGEVPHHAWVTSRSSSGLVRC